MEREWKAGPMTCTTCHRETSLLFQGVCGRCMDAGVDSRGAHSESWTLLNLEASVRALAEIVKRHTEEIDELKRGRWVNTTEMREDG